MPFPYSLTKNTDDLQCFSDVKSALDFLNNRESDRRSAQEKLIPYCLEVRAQEDNVLGHRYRTQYNIEAPKGSKSGNKTHVFNVEEEIFGTGFHMSQAKEMAVLELLAMIASQNKDDPFDRNQADELDTFTVLKMHRTLLRRILFNNHFMSSISQMQLTDDGKWSRWSEQFVKNNQLPEAKNSKGKKDEDDDDDDETVTRERIRDLKEEDLQYLQGIFGSFASFEKAVNLLRSWSILNDNERQWPFQFLFPFGVESLFWECTNELVFKNNYMTGAGQIVFNMLARSYFYRSDKSKYDINLGKTLNDYFLEQADAVNVYAQIISEGIEGEVGKKCTYEIEEQKLLHKLRNEVVTCVERSRISVNRSGSSIVRSRYFPYQHLDVFDRISDDIANALSLPLNKQEQFLVLGTICFLNLNVFLLQQQQKLLKLGKNDSEQAKDTTNIDMVLAIDNNSVLKKFSQARLAENEALYRYSVKHYCECRIRSIINSFAPFLLDKTRIDHDEQELFIQIARAAFSVDKKYKIDLNSKEEKLPEDPTESNQNIALDNGKTISYQELVDFFTSKISARDYHMERVHTSYCADIGLINRAKGANRNYAMTDDLIRILVITVLGNKKAQMKASEFLQILYKRYYIVIGPLEGQQYFKNKKGHEPDYLDEKRFSDNRSVFIERLRKLDLLISLSDGYEYIKNPFANSLNQQNMEKIKL